MYQIRRADNDFIVDTWQRLRSAGGNFRNEIGTDFESFHKALRNTAFVVPLNGGILYFEKRDDPEVLQVHGLFWSHKIFSQEVVLKRVGTDLLKNNVRRLECTFPFETKGLHVIMQMAGFEFEGRLRKHFNWQGNIYDGAIYSRVKEDTYGR